MGKTILKQSINLIKVALILGGLTLQIGSAAHSTDAFKDSELYKRLTRKQRPKLEEIYDFFTSQQSALDNLQKDECSQLLLRIDPNQYGRLKDQFEKKQRKSRKVLGQADFPVIKAFLETRKIPSHLKDKKKIQSFLNPVIEAIKDFEKHPNFMGKSKVDRLIIKANFYQLLGLNKAKFNQQMWVIKDRNNQEKLDFYVTHCQSLFQKLLFVPIDKVKIYPRLFSKAVGWRNIDEIIEIYQNTDVSYRDTILNYALNLLHNPRNKKWLKHERTAAFSPLFDFLKHVRLESPEELETIYLAFSVISKPSIPKLMAAYRDSIQENRNQILQDILMLQSRKAYDPKTKNYAQRSFFLFNLLKAFSDDERFVVVNGLLDLSCDNYKLILEGPKKRHHKKKASQALLWTFKIQKARPEFQSIVLKNLYQNLWPFIFHDLMTAQDGLGLYEELSSLNFDGLIQYYNLDERLRVPEDYDASIQDIILQWQGVSIYKRDETF